MSKRISKISHKLNRPTISQKVILHAQLLTHDRPSLQNIISLSQPAVFCVKYNFTP